MQSKYDASAGNRARAARVADEQSTTESPIQQALPTHGYVHESKCAKINPETLVEELDIGNNYTGIRHCSESCGGLGCCCYPSSECLFYRIYCVPIDSTIYEIFVCPSLFETVKITCYLLLLLLDLFQGHRQSFSYDIEIHPYTVKKLHNTMLEVTTFSFLPMPTLNKRYITNGETTAYLLDNTAFSYACKGNPKHTNETECAIKDTCKCNRAEGYVPAILL